MRFPLLCMLAAAPLAASANNELWDLYPAAVGVAQFDGDGPVSAQVQGAWSLTAPGAPLAEAKLPVEVLDAAGTVTWTPPDFGPVMLQAEGDPVWTQLLTEDFTTANCDFTFLVELGVARLPAPEGYRLALRETLTWSGPPESCPTILKDYFNRAALSPVMPLHVQFWNDNGALVQPADNGRLEFSVMHELRRTRRLLPVEATAELDADPFSGEVTVPGAALLSARSQLVRARLGPLIFKDSFEP